MSGRLIGESATVPIAKGKDVHLEPGKPWPAPYRGSRYSILDSKRHGTVLQWKYNDLVVHVEPPNNLLDQLRFFGKSRGSGKGSIRITAGREILTKIHTTAYSYSDEAPVDTGWIPVYLGKLDGGLGFDINIDPDLPNTDLWVWDGFSFNHGESWSVSYDGELIWKWQDYRFESIFDHTDLVSTYERYRTTAGRMYINEFGHIYVNVPRDEIPSGQREEIQNVFDEWQTFVEQNRDAAAQRLVDRRLKVTGDGDPTEGHLPLYIGHLSEFDEGIIPKPIVTDEEYYIAASNEEVGGY
ncbi:hypothetical protein [Halalkalirubrum salinum]|uniref:hypothetical protein n=1 Tax=Halalkalirubrum salinum TaxID=2563889 RepID=UPI0010FBB476|nr:hypothetical protein [Halalkalirubrum salinum]